MFGNLIGWIISAVLVVLAVLAGNVILSVAQPTAASGSIESKASQLTLDDQAKAVLPPMDNLKDDVNDLYRQASANYEQNKPQYETLQKARDLKEVDYASLTGLDALVKASSCPSMDLFKAHPEEIVGFSSSVTVLDNLEEVAKAAEQLVVLAHGDKQYDLARKYAVAVQVLGYHLYHERAAYDELSTGESLLGAADTLLISLDEDQNLNDQRSAVMSFEAARKDEYANKIEPVVHVLRALGPQNLRDYAGDFYVMAADPAVDRVWRVEAIRRIGRLHFDAENKADQIKSRKFLARQAVDTSQDPVILAAAKAALNMTAGDNQCER
jgi:hypothetical protein